MIENTSTSGISRRPERCPCFAMRALVRFVRNGSGATAIEYGLIAALIAVSCIFALQNLSISLIEIFNPVEQEVQDAAQCVQVGSNCKK
jgi:pilus assembly protein Flp/PilA